MQFNLATFHILKIFCACTYSFNIIKSYKRVCVNLETHHTWERFSRSYGEIAQSTEFFQEFSSFPLIAQHGLSASGSFGISRSCILESPSAIKPARVGGHTISFGSFCTGSTLLQVHCWANRIMTIYPTHHPLKPNFLSNSNLFIRKLFYV